MRKMRPLSASSKEDPFKRKFLGTNYFMLKQESVSWWTLKHTEANIKEPMEIA